LCIHNDGIAKYLQVDTAAVVSNDIQVPCCGFERGLFLLLHPKKKRPLIYSSFEIFPKLKSVNGRIQRKYIMISENQNQNVTKRKITREEKNRKRVVQKASCKFSFSTNETFIHCAKKSC